MKSHFIFLASILFSFSVHSASFDCTEASTLVEKAICTESQISNLDDLLMQSYKKALANSTDTSGLKSSQRDWLKEVRNRCQDSACLKRVYNDRLTALSRVTASISTSTEIGINGTYQYTEKGFSGTMKVSEISECEFNPKQLGCLSSMMFIAKINTMHNASANDCDIDVIENKSARITSGPKTEVTFIARDKNDGDTSFTVKFNQTGADIESVNIASGCGVRGSIYGHWKRSNG